MRYSLTSLTKSWSYPLRNRTTTRLETGWINEIRQSRLVVLPGEDSYLQDINIVAWELMEQLANGVTEAELSQAHPIPALLRLIFEPVACLPTYALSVSSDIRTPYWFSTSLHNATYTTDSTLV